MSELKAIPLPGSMEYAELFGDPYRGLSSSKVDKDGFFHFHQKMDEAQRSAQFLVLSRHADEIEGAYQEIARGIVEGYIVHVREQLDAVVKAMGFDSLPEVIDWIASLGLQASEDV